MGVGQWTATNGALSMEVELELEGAIHRVRVEKKNDTYRLAIGRESFEVTCRTLTPTTRLLCREGRPSIVHLLFADGAYRAFARGWALSLKRATRSSADHAAHGPSGMRGGQLCAPMPGKLTKLFVREGQQVHAGERVAVLEAMKMEHDIRSPIAGKVVRVNFAESSLVDTDQPLIEIESDTGAGAERET